MISKLIELEDGTLVEIEGQGDEYKPISGNLAEKVEASFDKAIPLLQKIAHSFSTAWSELNQDMLIDSAEIELGLSFEGEGNIYITKAKAGANIIVKLGLKPRKNMKE